MTSDAEFVYKYFTSPLTSGRVWQTDSGKQIGVSEILGNLFASPSGRWISVYNNRIPLGVYDSTLSNEFLEPVAVRDKFLRYGFVSSFSRDEALMAVDTPLGVVIRELPSKDLQKEIGLSTYDELAWIWNWLAFAPRAYGGYEPIGPETAFQNLETKIAATNKEHGAWTSCCCGSWIHRMIGY